jgi:hypothetical protein
MKVKLRDLANQNPDFLSNMADSIRDAWVSEDESEPVVEQEEEKKNEFTSGTEIDSRKESGPTDVLPCEQEAVTIEYAATQANPASTELLWRK